MLLSGAWFEEIAFALFVIVLVAKSYRSQWWFWRKSHHKKEGRLKTVQDIPGPFALPFLGTRWIFSCFGPYQMNYVHLAYEDLYQRYGRLCREEALWNVPVVSIFFKEDIEAVLNRSSKYPLRPPQEPISYYRQTRKDRYTNLGLVNEQGETWHILRRAFTPAIMASSTVRGFFPALNVVADDFNDLIRSRRCGTIVSEFEDIAYRLGLESTCTLILGKHLGFLKAEECSSITSKLAEAVRVHFTAARDAFYGLPLWKVLPTSAYKQLIESEDNIYNIISDLVDTAQLEQEGDAKDEDIEAVFKSILRVEHLDMRDKKAAIIDFIAAGIHTLGNTVVFLLYLIAKHPEVQKRVYEEVSTLVPPRCDISDTTLRKAEYLEAFIKETFRIMPTIPSIARILDTPMNFGEYRLEAGTVVLMQTWIACLSEDNFKDAKKCLPERWLSHRPYSPHSEKLLVPFGVGVRICPGKRFVNQALQLILAKTIREFEIIAEEELDIQSEFIMAPKGPVSLIFRNRFDAT